MSPKDNSWHEEFAKRIREKKSHVSFSQLKYPSMRDEPYRDSHMWLKAKSMDDGAEGLWRVHDGLYDLNDFVKKHPGGEEWLRFTKGTDITEAFEVHHLSPAVPELLKTFFVRKAVTPRNSPFTFHEDGFYKTLKAKVVETLKKIPKKENTASNLINDGVALTMVVASIVSCMVNSCVLVALFGFIGALFMAWTPIAAHNYIHRKDNWRMYLYNIVFSPYGDFRISHALSHHLYANTLLDLEISMYDPIFPWNPREKGIYAKLAFFVELIIFPTIFTYNILTRLYFSIVDRKFFKERVRITDFIGLLLPVMMYVFGNQSCSQTFFLWMCIQCTASFLYHSFGLYGSHHHPDIFHDGDQLSTETPDWGIHELEAVIDRKDCTGNLFLVLTFYGDHALHHLFPTVDHAHLAHLYPLFLEHCEQYKANFRMTSSFDLFIGHIKQLMRTEPKCLE